MECRQHLTRSVDGCGACKCECACVYPNPCVHTDDAFILLATHASDQGCPVCLVIRRHMSQACFSGIVTAHEHDLSSLLFVLQLMGNCQPVSLIHITRDQPLITYVDMFKYPHESFNDDPHTIMLLSHMMT